MGHECRWFIYIFYTHRCTQLITHTIKIQCHIPELKILKAYNARHSRLLCQRGAFNFVWPVFIVDIFFSFLTGPINKEKNICHEIKPLQSVFFRLVIFKDRHLWSGLREIITNNWYGYTLSYGPLWFSLLLVKFSCNTGAEVYPTLTRCLNSELFCLLAV